MNQSITDNINTAKGDSRKKVLRPHDDPAYAAHMVVMHAPAKCPSCKSTKSSIDGKAMPVPTVIGRFHTCSECGTKFRSVEELAA